MSAYESRPPHAFLVAWRSAESQRISLSALQDALQATATCEQGTEYHDLLIRRVYDGKRVYARKLDDLETAMREVLK